MQFTPRVDPCVNSAIEFALKYGICKKVAQRKYKLTTLGKKYVESILKDNIMSKEKSLLRDLGQNFTEEMLDRI